MKHLILAIAVICLVSCIGAKAPEPVTVIAPVSAATTVLSDSSFFKLNIKNNKFEIDFLNNIAVMDSLSYVDSFLQKNIALINKDKVIVAGFDTSKVNTKLVAVLSKYGLSKFTISDE
jgi:archaellum biogenesis ATPase FlaH